LYTKERKGAPPPSYRQFTKKEEEKKEKNSLPYSCFPCGEEYREKVNHWVSAVNRVLKGKGGGLKKKKKSFSTRVLIFIHGGKDALKSLEGGKEEEANGGGRKRGPP